MSRRKKMIIGVLVALLGGLGWFAFSLWHIANVTVPDAYAVWNTATLVNDYMDAHEGAWPSGWEDLRKTSDTSHLRYPGSFTDLRARVEVDWKADPEVLAAAPVPAERKLPFRVIWLKDAGHASWAGAEPNWLIWIHLRERTTKKLDSQTQPATSQSLIRPRGNHPFADPPRLAIRWSLV